MVPQAGLGDDFWNKTIPVLTIGMIIWVIFALAFSEILSTTLFSLTSILFVILYIFLWIFAILFSFKKQNFLSMVLFLGASAISGILSAYLLVWARLMLVSLDLVLGLFFIAFFISIGVTVGILVLGLVLKDRIGEKWIYPLLLFGFILVVLEFSLIFMFGYNPILIITSILVLVWLFGVILWDGSRLPQTIKDGYWMMAVINIFLDMINVIIRVFIIIVQIVAGEK